MVNCSYADYHLHGDYVLVDTVRDLLLWNWKENSIGRFDERHSGWGNGQGFAVTALPPYLFIVPQEKQETLVVEIPHLHPLGTPESLEPVRSPSVSSHPFLENIAGLSHMKLHHFDRWRSSTLSGGTVMIQSMPSYDDPSLFHLISLHPKDTAPLVSSHPVQITGVPPKLDTPDADVITMVPSVGVIFLNWPVHYEPYDERLYAVEPERGVLYTSFHPFTADGSIGNVIDREIEVTYPCEGTPAQLDLMSGAVVVKGQNAGDEPSTHIIGIISFD
ncbi:hypothetical protein DL93DRAFT_1981985 [Clavulina sp. PMI_390]|nr:hypothetical protein DL93DRAFT_1981985 [Clavulina sp. PMI_390]